MWKTLKITWFISLPRTGSVTVSLVVPSPVREGPHSVVSVTQRTGSVQKTVCLDVGKQQVPRDVPSSAVDRPVASPLAVRAELTDNNVRLQSCTASSPSTTVLSGCISTLVASRLWVGCETLMVTPSLALQTLWPATPFPLRGLLVAKRDVLNNIRTANVPNDNAKLRLLVFSLFRKAVSLHETAVGRSVR